MVEPHDILSDLTAAELVAALSAAGAPMNAGASHEEIRDLALLGLVRLGLSRTQDLNESYGLGWSLVHVKRTHVNDNPETRAQVSALIRQHMAERSWSLARLAKATYYSKGYLSRVVNGVKRLSPQLAAQLDEALDTDGTFAQLASGPPDIEVAAR